MFTESQTKRIARKTALALVQALDAWPHLLATSEPDAAAEVIAGIIKATLARPTPPIDPQAALDNIIKRLSDNADSTT